MEKESTLKNESKDRSLTKISFLIGLSAIMAATYLQYVILGLNLISGILLVYGVPILITSAIWGRTIIAKSLRDTYNTLKYGPGYFGAFTVLGLILGTIVIFLLYMFDPAAVNLLNKPNPVLQVSPEIAWLMVASPS